MTLLKQLFTLCLCIACLYSCQDKTPNDSLEGNTTVYAQFVEAMKAKGLATGNILVYEDGEVLFKSSRGLRTTDPIDSLDLNSQFRLASVSKQFTGMAIMKLKAAGKLDYDQEVHTILTDFPYTSITVRQLLHHTSGLTDYERIIDRHFVKADSTKQYILGNEAILDLFYRVNPKLDFQPGAQWEYSNTGYIVLASIVEKLSGQHFRTFLKEHITDPIGMTNTVLYKYQVDADPNMPHRVFGYRKALNQTDLVSNDYNIVNDVRGDGGIYSTLDDLFKWNMALSNHSIIPKAYLDEAWTSGQTNDGEYTGYGFGWFLDYNPGEPRVLSHSGGWVGFVTYLQNDVDAKSGFVLLTNDSGENANTILEALESIRANGTYQKPRTSVYKAMAKHIYKGDTQKALSWYHEVKADTIAYRVSENDINQLGYLLLNDDKVDAATAIFQLNKTEHPTSANVYDSYGDALLRQGDSIDALTNFKRCFEMDASLEYAKDKAEALEKALSKT